MFLAILALILIIYGGTAEWIYWEKPRFENIIILCGNIMYN